jgi:transcriptional regulator with XRE-family HTH domain
MQSKPTNVPPASFAAKFRAIRLESGYSLRGVAKATGVSSAYLTDIEYGRRMPSRAIIEKVAKALGRPKEDLLIHDPRESVGVILTVISESPQFSGILAKICLSLKSGNLSVATLEGLCVD